MTVPKTAMAPKPATTTTVTLPILRAIHKKHGKVGLVHIDAHADVNDHMFGEKIAHGTTFRRARTRPASLTTTTAARASPIWRPT